MIRRPPRSTQSRSSAASDVYKRQCVQSAARKVSLLSFWSPQAPSGSHEVDLLYILSYEEGGVMRASRRGRLWGLFGALAVVSAVALVAAGCGSSSSSSTASPSPSASSASITVAGIDITADPS